MVQYVHKLNRAHILIRNTLNEIYFGKTRDIVNGLRSVQPLAEKSQQEALQKDLFKAINAKGGAKEWCHGDEDNK